MNYLRSYLANLFILIILLILPLQETNLYSKIFVQKDNEIDIKVNGLQISASGKTYQGEWFIDPDKEYNGSIESIVFNYRGKEYTMRPAHGNEELCLRTIVMKEGEKIGFPSFLFKGSLVLERNWNIESCFNAGSPIAKSLLELTTKSNFKTKELDNLVNIYTTEGIVDGCIEIVFHKSGSGQLIILPMIKNPQER